MDKVVFYCVFSVILFIVIVLFYRLFLDGFHFVVNSVSGVDISTRDYAMRLTVDRDLKKPIVEAADYPGERASVTIEGVLWNVEVVDSLLGRSQGLSDRDSLPYDQGMLFVFESSDYHYFWMKGMRFPLDIIWIKSTGPDTGIVVGADQNVDPLSFTTFQRFAPREPIDMVLEVNAGQYEKFGLHAGSLVIIQ